MNEFTTKTTVTKELFVFLTKLMNETKVANYLEVVFEPVAFVTMMLKLIKDRPILESGPNINNEDFVLSGLLNLLKATLRKRIDIRDAMPHKEELITYLLHDCLFHKETNRDLLNADQFGYPKCKSRNTRYACLSLVRELTVDN